VLARLVGLLRPFQLPGLPALPAVLARVALVYPQLVPFFVRWRSASNGLGYVVAQMVASSGETPGAVLQRIGEEQGRALREGLGYGVDLRECARAVALANRLYAIKASVKVGSGGEIQVQTPGCPWSRHEWWGPQPCGAFSRFEVGLVAGLNPAVRLRYTCKRTRGDSRCVGEYTWAAESERGPAAP
jgi:hypothetical protein